MPMAITHTWEANPTNLISIVWQAPTSVMVHSPRLILYKTDKEWSEIPVADDYSQSL